MQLRLYSGDQAAASVPTVADFFAEVFLPLRGASADQKTVGLWRDAVAWWVRLTGDCPVDQVDDFQAAQFVAALAAAPGRRGPTLSRYTVRRHCLALQAIFDMAGPKTAGRRGRQNRGLLAVPPVFVPPPVDRPEPRGDFTAEELAAVIAAADQLPASPPSRGQTPGAWPYPEGVTPAAWWRAFVVFAVQTGARVAEIMQCQWREFSPDRAEWCIPNAHAKRRRGRRQYVTAAARAALATLPATGPDGLVFAWRNWAANPRWHLAVWKKLSALAGLPPDRRFGFHGLRKFHASALAAAGGTAAGVALAQASLGHASAAVTAGHYVNGAVQRAALAAALEQLPALIAATDRQGRLF